MQPINRNPAISQLVRTLEKMKKKNKFGASTLNRMNMKIAMELIYWLVRNDQSKELLYSRWNSKRVYVVAKRVYNSQPLGIQHGGCLMAQPRDHSTTTITGNHEEVRTCSDWSEQPTNHTVRRCSPLESPDRSCLYHRVQHR